MEINSIGDYRTQAYASGVRAEEERAGDAARARSGRSVGPDKEAAVLSTSAQSMQRVRKAVVEASDVRPDKVAAIKQSIENGAYRVSSEEILGALLKPFK